MLLVFGYLSGILSAISYIPYIWYIIQRKVKPERASWLIWSVLGSIAIFSQLAKGASHSLWLPGIQTIGVLIVFLLSIKFGVGGLVRRDILALFFAGIGLGLWYLTNEATIALFIVIAIDTIGSALTVIKSYHDPASETISTWALSGTAGIFAVLSVGAFNAILLAYPFYIFLANFAVVAAIYLGFRKQRVR